MFCKLSYVASETEVVFRLPIELQERKNVLSLYLYFASPFMFIAGLIEVAFKSSIDLFLDLIEMDNLVIRCRKEYRKHKSHNFIVHKIASLYTQ